MKRRIGIIGGSGVYSLDGLVIENKLKIETPFGKTSAPVILADYEGVSTAFIARHGKGHVLTPSEVPYAANIYALKHLGVQVIISVSAVGSLQERFRPRHFVIPDQIFDRTKGIRRSTFFGDGIVGHVGFGSPFCPELSDVLAKTAKQADATVHKSGTLVCMEGPQFSTKAESEFYRGLGHSIIGMTAIPEAKLAREAGICYSILAMVTDYDVWHEDEADVTVEQVIANVRVNTERARKTLGYSLHLLNKLESMTCSCCGSSEDAIMTDPKMRPPLRMKHLKTILER